MNFLMLTTELMIYCMNVALRFLKAALITGFSTRLLSREVSELSAAPELRFYNRKSFVETIYLFFYPA